MRATAISWPPGLTLASWRVGPEAPTGSGACSESLGWQVTGMSEVQNLPPTAGARGSNRPGQGGDRLHGYRTIGRVRPGKGWVEQVSLVEGEGWTASW